MRSLYILLSILLWSVQSIAQDPQFSQYYNAPLFINPAFAGGTDCYRAGANARVQWFGLNGSFKTAAIYADLNYPDLNSGFGVMVLHDNIGRSRLSSNEASAFYSYLASFSEQFNIRMGLQAGFVSRNINYNNLTFEDQYSGTSVTNQYTSDQVTQYTNKQYFDASSGIVFYGEDTYWLGISAHHLTRPDQAFYGIEDSRLPIRYSLHGGYNFYHQTAYRQTKEEMLRIIPTFMYKGQGKFDQLDLGVYLMNNPWMLGVWYRGIFPKKYENIRNNDALIVQAGFNFSSFSFTYSYDITTSKLGLGNTMGSHEISLVYLFCLEWPPRKKPGRYARKLPCPDFQKGR